MNKLYLLLLSLFISLKSFGATPSSTDYPNLVFTPIEGTEECSVKANTDNNPTGDLVIPAEVLIGNQLYKVTAIGDRAFFQNASLTSVVIPDGVTTIGESAFRICTSLASINIPEGVTTIGAYAFQTCAFTEITIPEGVTAIGDNAFFGCSQLKSVTIPGSVTTMGKDTFQRCTGLTTVEIKEGVTTIGNYAFDYCSNLASVTIPGSVTTIGDAAFQNCSSLASIKIPASVTSIGKSAFSDCKKLASINIPQNVTTIDVATFNGCSSLASIEIPASVTSIGNFAFKECTSLASINIPQNVTAIGEEAFKSCTKLASITISEGVATIGESAFSSCYKLNSVTIPGSVTTIGDEAFAGCEKLKEVVVKATDVPSGGTLMFGNPENFTGSIVVPKESFTAYQNDNSWSVYIKNIKASVTVGVEFTVDGLKYRIISLDPATCEVIGYVVIPTEPTELTIPASANYLGTDYSVTAIGDKAFYKNTSVTSVKIPTSVTSIGNNAFERCTSLTSVTIPGSVTVVNSEAFIGCTGLKSVTMDKGVVKIGDHAFYSCRALESVVIPDGVTEIETSAFTNCKSLTSVTIPGTVKTIGSYAFQNCESLTSIEIPDGVTTIGDEAFSSCTKLKHVVIPKTVTSIGRNAFDGIKEPDAKVYIYSSAEFDETIFSEYWVFTIYVVNSDMVDYYKEKYPSLNVYPMLTIQGADSDEPLLVEMGKPVEMNITLPEGYKPTLLWIVGEEGEGSEELIINSHGEENVVTAKVYDANNPAIYTTVKLRGYLAGDSNDNGVVAIDDAVTTANHIVGNTPDKFLMEAADVVNPEQTDPVTGRVIDIRDVVATVDIVLAAPAQEESQATDIHYAPGHLTDCLNINADGDCLLLTLTGTGAFSALQADVTLPEGAILTDVHAGDRLTSSHSVMYRMIDDRTVRVVVFAMSLDTFMPGNSVVRLQLDAPVSGGVTAANVIASDSEGGGYRLGVNGNGTTGIDGIGNDGNGVNIGTVNGAITVDGAEGAAVEVYGIDGRRIAAFVADGDSVRLDVVPGVYLVRVGTAKAVKIVVR